MMDSQRSQLPWDELHRAEGDIPWPALRRIAEAAAADPEITRELFDIYDRTYERAGEQVCYADLYVPGIFALAAPNLDDEQRHAIGEFLVARLAEAGADDADLSLEVLTAAVGTLGPTILPTVLDAIAKEPDTLGAWGFLWGLTLLAAETDDEQLRNQVIQACVELLQRADRDETDIDDAHHAAWTLGLLRCTEYEDLLKRLRDKAAGTFIAAEYDEAVQLLMQGKLEYTPPPELWEQPVEEWLTSRWKMARDWFAKRESEAEDEDERDEEEVDSDRHFIAVMTVNFLMSPIARTLPQELRYDAHRVLSQLLNQSLTSLDTSPQEWDEKALRELLLEILPCKGIVDETLARKIPAVLEAFLLWLGSDGLLDGAEELAAAVRSWSDQIITAQADRERWGAAKARLVNAREAGADIFDPAFSEQFVEEHVAEFLGSQPPQEPQPEPERIEPPVPIVEHSPKTGRNDPCPCGSGKKYKKCCGSPARK